MATNNNPLLNCPPLRFPEFSDPWKKTTLGEVAEFIQYRGKSNTLYLSVESFLPNFQGIADLQNDTQSSGIGFEPDDVLMSNIRPYLRKVWYANRSGTCSPDVLVFRSKSVILPKFLYSIIANQSFVSYIMQGAKGVKMPRGDKQQMLLYSFSLPHFSEQGKIAKFLSLIDERIETQRQTIEERKKQKKALLHQIFSQSLRFPNFSAPWQQTTLGEVCTIKTGKLDANAMVEDGSYPFFTCAKQTYQTDTYSFSGEAILIAGNGEVGLTKYYNGKFNAYQRTYVLQSLSSDVILLFIKNHIDYTLPKRIISFLNGSAMPYITLSTLSDMPICLPSLEEQRKIAKLLAIFDERIEAEEALLKCYESQKRYLLRQMFCLSKSSY